MISKFFPGLFNLNMLNMHVEPTLQSLTRKTNFKNAARSFLLGETVRNCGQVSADNTQNRTTFLIFKKKKNSQKNTSPIHNFSIDFIIFVLGLKIKQRCIHFFLSSRICSFFASGTYSYQLLSIFLLFIII